MKFEMGVVTGVDDLEQESEIDDLEKARLLTEMMREHQTAVIRLGNQRRNILRRLRARRVPYRVIAQACGVTDQALFADLRKHRQDD